ncbi:hypothetical protein [Microbacterium sp. LWS13-1.2]|uniref:Glyoxalase/fosfomycin resistance/dioxygenase domain-containing protein n=1 Tax=Microbacterium sp. LWS13-1.2 TaxID=3135264 RepID=A0AAU6SEU7_9MICO
MDVQLVAGFGPIVRDDRASQSFYRDDLGIALGEAAPGYLDTHALGGVKVFPLWRLTDAAESIFGSGNGRHICRFRRPGSSLNSHRLKPSPPGSRNCARQVTRSSPLPTWSPGVRPPPGFSAPKGCWSASRSSPDCTTPDWPLAPRPLSDAASISAPIDGAQGRA